MWPKRLRKQVPLRNPARSRSSFVPDLASATCVVPSVGTLKATTQDDLSTKPGAWMVWRLVIAIAVLAGSALNGAHAQNPPWCAYLTGSSPDCAFATFQECLKAIQGKTGICDRNAESTGPTKTDSASPSAAAPNSAVTGTIGAEAVKARQHRLHHRSAPHLRSRKTKKPSGMRNRFSPHRHRKP